jgi:palmitoyl-protein thioesterase
LQVELFAAAVRNDSKLARGFNLIGHSQGGLITRAYVERFNDPPVYNLVSLAGPHDGVFGVPALNALCPDHFCPWLGKLFDELLASGATRAVQEVFTFASYWKDTMNYSEYLRDNIFLADINNERAKKNATYRSHMTSLNALALVYSTTDDIVVPRQSPWFKFFAEGSDQRPLVPMALSPSYLGDWIGLRTLDDGGRLKRFSVSCGHQDMPRDDCLNQSYVGTVQQLLNNTL